MQSRVTQWIAPVSYLVVTSHKQFQRTTQSHLKRESESQYLLLRGKKKKRKRYFTIKFDPCTAPMVLGKCSHSYLSNLGPLSKGVLPLISCGFIQDNRSLYFRVTTKVTGLVCSLGYTICALEEGGVVFL